MRRADVDVCDVLVALRDLGQHRCVVAKGRFHIPAGEIAPDRGPVAIVPCGVDQQQSANGRSLIVEHVAEARETFGHLAHGHAPEPLHPVVSRAARKAAGQKIGDGVEIGYSYLAASDHGPNSVMGSDPASSSASRRADRVRRGALWIGGRPACVRGDEPEFRNPTSFDTFR
jgi:hypothetical protein